MNLYRKDKKCHAKNDVVWIDGIVNLSVINGDENVNAATNGSKGAFKCLKI